MLGIRAVGRYFMNNDVGTAIECIEFDTTTSINIDGMDGDTTSNEFRLEVHPDGKQYVCCRIFDSPFHVSDNVTDLFEVCLIKPVLMFKGAIPDLQNEYDDYRYSPEFED